MNDERERGVERSLKWVCSKVSYMYIYRRLSASDVFINININININK